ncbi:MAG: hypothetical protein WBY94_19675, partial [Polyangiaceae bacterium]
RRARIDENFLGHRTSDYRAILGGASQFDFGFRPPPPKEKKLNSITDFSVQVFGLKTKRAYWRAARTCAERHWAALSDSASASFENFVICGLHSKTPPMGDGNSFAEFQGVAAELFWSANARRACLAR